MKRAKLLSTALLLSALAAACSEDKSFVVVRVLGSLSIANVVQLRVKVTDGQYSEQLLYPETPRAATALLQLDPNTPVTFSVSFRTMFKDDVVLDVEPLDTGGASLGRGTSVPQPLKLGQVTYVTVEVTPPTCDPMAPVATCGHSYTCALVCDQNSQPDKLCFPAGLGNPGESCADTTNCAPGSACFEFTTCSTVAQPVKTCRKFCTGDSICGTGSSCIAGVSCDNASTSFRLCSRPCDPTGDATLGCAPGLLCFIYSGETTDCACRDQSRAGAVGASCATDDACQPGLLCVDRGSAKSCQAICQLSSPKCSTGTCTRLTNPDYQVYGACL